jgi:hypothetical protein
MNITNEHFFPLAKFIVETQQKKLGFTINHLILFNSSNGDLEVVGGYYDHPSRTIGLNIANLYLFRGKYELKCKLRVAAAIVLEECYHASCHGEDYNTDAHAAWYGALHAAKLPEEFLVAQGGQLYKNITTNKKEKKKMQLGNIPVTLTGGGMFEFVNKVKTFANDSKESHYGHITLENDAHTTSLTILTDLMKLNIIKKALGNTGRASAEYAGVIYVFDINNGGWKTYIDVDQEQMVEIDINKALNITLTKHEDGEHLEAVSGG